ncbi:MAG: hydantoinase B/oxoprolinase family protein [Deltaproteobacteria bacterium]|nr:hydantoinase B/oxoprolinase family protein [Deltaproteobacteria bacterium]
MKVNPVLLEVFKNRFSSISEEMGVTLNRTAFSPNIKERRDFSCAVFDKKGEMVAQAAHIPVHLGSMPLSVKAAIENTRFSQGDMVMLNDPFKGGTHLPDITVVAPVFIRQDDDTPFFFTANRAHHSDVGGMSSGSMPLSSSIFQEGIIIPPLKILKQGKIDDQIMSFLLNNVRTPVEREGDFAAQIMANITGVKRIRELADKYTSETVDFYANRLIDYSEKITRQTIQKVPDGLYEFEDIMEDDGHGNENIKIKVAIQVQEDRVTIDFSQSDTQVQGSINAVYAITLSSVLYVFRSLIKENIPTNAGCFKPIQLKTRKGTVVDAEFPAAVAGGNVETSQRIVDVLFGALAKALPDAVPAAGQGTMNNIAIGGTDKRNQAPFTYYETIGGGMGATADNHGESAVHSHMTNTLNTPVEALEYSYPFIVTQYSIRKGSGGKGLFNGGDGIVREIKLISDAEVTVLSERRTHPPYGLFGGNPGKTGRNILIKNGIREEKPGRIETPGGGGYGQVETESK